jgi:hypothetical protein
LTLDSTTTKDSSSTAEATNAGEAVDQGDQTEGGQDHARDVERGAVAAALRLTDDEVRTGRSDDGERDVHEERPAPVQVLGEEAAQDQTDGTAAAGDRAVDAERLGALLGIGEHHGEQGERGGREQGSEDTLERSGAEHHRLVGGRTAQRGGHGEAAQAHDEGLLAAPQVGYPAAEQEQTAEGEGVGRDDPLPVAVGDAQVLLGGGQGDVHDGGVQDDHQLGQRDEDERFPAAGVRRGRRSAECLRGCFRHGDTHFGTR